MLDISTWRDHRQQSTRLTRAHHGKSCAEPAACSNAQSWAAEFCQLILSLFSFTSPLDDTHLNLVREAPWPCTILSITAAATQPWPPCLSLCNYKVYCWLSNFPDVFTQTQSSSLPLQRKMNLVNGSLIHPICLSSSPMATCPGKGKNSQVWTEMIVHNLALNH